MTTKTTTKDLLDNTAAFVWSTMMRAAGGGFSVHRHESEMMSAASEQRPTETRRREPDGNNNGSLSPPARATPIERLAEAILKMSSCGRFCGCLSLFLLMLQLLYNYWTMFVDVDVLFQDLVHSGQMYYYKK